MVPGGSSDAAPDRVARYGDRWYGCDLPMDEVGERIDTLSELCRQPDRDAAPADTAVSTRHGTPQVPTELGHSGVDQLVVVESPSDGVEDAATWVVDLTGHGGIH